MLQDQVSANNVSLSHSHSHDLDLDMDVDQEHVLVTATEQPVERNIPPQAHFNQCCMVSQNYVEPDVPIEQLLTKQNSAPQLHFPHLSSRPINMFQQGSLEEQAFPVLFPKGRYGLDYPRTKPITDLKYFQNRLFNKDARWRNSTVWVFWALNMFEMRKLQNEISIVSRKKKTKPSAPNSWRHNSTEPRFNESVIHVHEKHTRDSCILERPIARTDGLKSTQSMSSTFGLSL